jgi:hypothetical protein
LPPAFIFTVAFFWAGFFVDFFLGTPLFVGITFLPAVLFDLVGLFLDFFLVAIRGSLPPAQVRHEAALLVPIFSSSRLSLILVPPLPRYNESRYGDSGRDAQYG